MPRTALMALALTLVAGCSDPADPAPVDPDVAQDANDAGGDAMDTADDVARDVGPDVIDADVPDTPDDADAEPDLPLDPNAIVFRYNPQGEGFYRMPWPSDGRLGPLGGPDLSDFPNRTATLDLYLTEVEAVRGFATMPVAYFPARSEIPIEALPDVLATIDPASPIQLVDLSEEGCGRRYPVDLLINAEGDDFHEAGTLQIANAIGTILEPGRAYGFVILGSLGQEQGLHTPRPASFDADLMAAAHLQPLRDCLPTAGVSLDDVAVATVFTTQDAVGEMQRLRDFVMDPDKIETRPLVRWGFSEAWSRKSQRIMSYEGTVEMPIFQDGVTPYSNEGGALVFDDDGTPVVQRWEEVDIVVAWRTLDEEPNEPRPILVFEDGTGWTPWDHLRSNWVNAALDAGFVVASFIPQFHGGRAGFGGSTEISTYNLVNPRAARGNFRQQAAEASYFLRLLREQISVLEGPPPVDPQRVVYGGHSQGAMCGSILAAVEDEYLAYSLNGLSTYFTLTILHRKDIIDFAFVVRSVFSIDRPLDRFYPILQMVQLGAEAVDPHNYAPRWKNDVFVVNGLLDDTTTKRGMDHLTMVANMPPLTQPGWEVDEQGVWDGDPVTAPVEDNALDANGPHTRATLLDGAQGHGTIYRNQRAREMAVDFWSSAVTDGARLTHRREWVCNDGADDDGDGATDCDDTQCAGDPACDEVVCDDGIDDDDDGDIDCADAACRRAENCVETVCDDGEDNEGDRRIDCDDPDCARRAPCFEEFCGDGIDNNGDETIDCADPQCAGRAPCAEEVCGDGVDDDGDGAVDCDDSECENRKPCAEIDCEDGRDDDGDGKVDCADDECRLNTDLCHERNCADRRDNDFDGPRDCDDPDCVRSHACPELLCDDGEDNDSSGLVDCDDPDCLGTEACPLRIETACDDGDDDDDGLADCADSDCALDPACHNPESCTDGDLGTATGIPVLVGTLDTTNDWRPGECLALGLGGGTPDWSLRWTAPASGQWYLTTYGSEADTVLTLFPDTCDIDREFGCSDDLGPISSSSIRLTIEEGQTVTIVVSGYAKTDTGAFQLHIYPVP